MVDVIVKGHYLNFKPEERVTFDDEEARQVVQAGYGVYATKADAKAVGAPEEQTAKAVKAQAKNQ